MERRATGCDGEDDSDGRRWATKSTMMATARQATKSTMMANARRATNLMMMASADDDDGNGVTTATTKAKVTARRATMTMTTLRRDGTTRMMSNDVNGRRTR